MHIKMVGARVGLSSRNISDSVRFISRSIYRPSSATDNSIHSKIGVASQTEAIFVLILGLLLSLNSGYINGLCLSGMLSENGSRRQAVSAFTGTYTKSGLALARGNTQLFGFEVGLIFSFICGACVAGALNPKAIPHKLVPSIGPTFLIGSAFMIVSAICADVNPEGRALFYFAAVANGLQNGVTSTYSANLIRTSHLTGTSTDIGLIFGQMIRGNWKSYWKFKVLCSLAASFWLGSLLSYYSASAFLDHSLWFSASLYLIIGFSHVAFVALTKKVSLIQACVGNWNWDKVLDRIADSMCPSQHTSGVDKKLLLSQNVDDIFDQVDTDGSGEIDCDELTTALEKLGLKLTKDNIQAMIAAVDENGDGVIDREEFRAMVSIANARARRKEEIRLNRRATVRNLAGSFLKKPSTSYTASDLDLDDGSDTESNLHESLPRTFEEAMGESKNKSRAIIVTETKHPFNIVAVNEPWEYLCGYKASEAVSKSMAIIQGPKTNRKGLKNAMNKLLQGSSHVECCTVNYRNDGSAFNNRLAMGPLYDGADDEDQKLVYYVGVLMNIGELASDLAQADENENNYDEA